MQRAEFRLHRLQFCRRIGVDHGLLIVDAAFQPRDLGVEAGARGGELAVEVGTLAVDVGERVQFVPQ
ncbi:MAG: hypothetical protein HND48_25235 [Chloroflexi bacterium]|nr:hypothetical protein [Chloroflexota bacterium]